MATARLKLRVASDGMSVTAEVSPGPAATKADIDSALAAARIAFGVDAKAVEALAKKLADPAATVHDFVIARGRPPAPGTHAHFDPTFHAGIQPGHLDADGHIDFYDRELLKPVKANECLGRLFEAVPGTPGRRVDGSEIAVAPVRGSSLRPGANVREDGDGKMIALCAGVVAYTADKLIDVVQQHVHAGDVDLRSGNLNMEGTLVIRGSVQHPFVVHATGDIDLQGGVDSGSVFAGGNLRITGGVRSGDTGQVCAEGDLSARYAEAAYLRCGGLLKIESALNCELAAAKIQIARTMRGGSAQAELSIVAQTAGSPSGGAGPVLAAGIPLERPLGDVKAALQAAKELRLGQRGGGARAGDARAKGGKAGRAGALQDRAALERTAFQAARRAELTKVAFIHVVGLAHPGVTIQLGACSLLIEAPVSNTRFVFDSEKQEIRQERPGK